MPRKNSKTRHRINAWLLARRVTQLLTFLAFLGIFLALKQWDLRQPISSLPFWLDPLAMISFNLSGRIWIPLTFLSILTLIVTILFGRVWCGWICPLGTLFDVFPSKKNNKGSKPDERLRKIKHILLIATLTTALFGSLFLLILDPLTLLFRSLTTFIWPVFNQVITYLEQVMYPSPLFRGIVSGFESSVRPLILPMSLEPYRFSLLFTVICIGIFLLNMISERFWCRYLCSLGGGLGLVSKMTFFKRQVDHTCTRCGICATKCPTGTIDPHAMYRSDPSECTVCMRCLDDCPRHATQFRMDHNPAIWQVYDPTKRDLLRTISVSATALFLLNLGETVLLKEKHPHLILPPGAAEPDFFSRCIRCSECMRVCPTGGLQPGITEAGLTGLWAPVLVPRIGHCEYNCNACGQVCPTKAITPLSVSEKRLQVIGTASIDKTHCIAWGDRRACIVCQEVCPLPQKAIILEDGLTSDNRSLKLPRVLAERCIGCGTCENKCPAAGQAAIRVFAKDNLS